MKGHYCYSWAGNLEYWCCGPLRPSVLQNAPSDIKENRNNLLFTWNNAEYLSHYLETHAFSIWCHFWISSSDSSNTQNQRTSLLPVYIFPIFSSGRLISRDRNANHLCSESESIICMQLNNSHNIVLLEKHPLKNILTIFFTAHKIWG